MRKGIVVALLMMSMLMCGCGGDASGISQEEYDKVVAERDALKNQVDSNGETDQFENETETVATEETVPE